MSVRAPPRCRLGECPGLTVPSLIYISTRYKVSRSLLMLSVLCVRRDGAKGGLVPWASRPAMTPSVSYLAPSARSGIRGYCPSAPWRFLPPRHRSVRRGAAANRCRRTPAARPRAADRPAHQRHQVLAQHRLELAVWPKVNSRNNVPTSRVHRPRRRASAFPHFGPPPHQGSSTGSDHCSSST